MKYFVDITYVTNGSNMANGRKPNHNPTSSLGLSVDTTQAEIHVVLMIEVMTIIHNVNAKNAISLF